MMVFLLTSEFHVRVVASVADVEISFNRAFDVQIEVDANNLPLTPQVYDMLRAELEEMVEGEVERLLESHAVFISEISLRSRFLWRQN